MDNPLRGLVKDLFIYGLSDGMGKGLTFLALLLYTRFLTPGDNGILSILNTGISLLYVVQSVGGESTYMRFFMGARNQAERQCITSTWLLFLLLWAGGTSALLLAFSGGLSSSLLSTPGQATPVMLIILIVPVMIINRICGQVLRNEFRPLAFALLNFSTIALSVVLSLWFGSSLNLGVAGILAGNLAANVFFLPIRLWSARHVLRLRISLPLLGDMLRFGGPLIAAEFAFWVFFNSDRYLLGRLSTLEQAGYYGLANTIVMIMLGAHAALGQTWPLRATKTYEDRLAGAAEQFGQVATYILISFGALGIAITVFSPEILAVLSRPAYYPATQAVGPLCLAALAYTSTQFTALSISLTRKTGYLVICSAAVAVLNVALNLVFIPIYGMMAASWSSALCYSLLTLAYLFISQRLWPISYERRRIGVTVAVVVLFNLAAPLLPTFGFAMNILIKLAYCMAYFGLLWVLRAVDRREWHVIKQVWGRLRIAWRGT